MESKKLIWIALAFMPVFLLPGTIIHFGDGVDNINLITIIKHLGFILIISPLYFLVFNYIQNKAADFYVKAKIDWGKWEKLGWRKFIAYRLISHTILALIISYVVIEAINYLYIKDNRLLVVFLTMYLGFSITLILYNRFWNIHQQKKAESQL
ncbi:MAG: hypothetical protein GY839_10085 [candidate division Zixibacteria bacterium]|nr:hypothetical protein [candidate division Zixibacteria bacterium]